MKHIKNIELLEGIVYKKYAKYNDVLTKKFGCSNIIYYDDPENGKLDINFQFYGIQKKLLVK